MLRKGKKQKWKGWKIYLWQLLGPGGDPDIPVHVLTHYPYHHFWALHWTQSRSRARCHRGTRRGGGGNHQREPCETYLYGSRSLRCRITAGRQGRRANHFALGIDRLHLNACRFFVHVVSRAARAAARVIGGSQSSKHLNDGAEPRSDPSINQGLAPWDDGTTGACEARSASWSIGRTQCFECFAVFFLT